MWPLCCVREVPLRRSCVLGDAEVIDALVHRWREEMDAARMARGPTASLRRLRELGADIRRLVWDPVVRHLGGAERVIIVPDGSLNLVPFAALPGEGTSYLLESGPTIHYLSAERDSGSSRQPARVGDGLLAIGAPAFESGAVTIGAGYPRVIPETRCFEDSRRIAQHFSQSTSTSFLRRARKPVMSHVSGERSVRV